MVYLILGVSGSGKTTIGKKLSEILAIPFYDADDYHNNKNIEKMIKGLPLNDTDRKLWLKLLSLKIEEWNLHGDAILACSALKKKYRRKLSSNGKVFFIFLDGEYNQDDICIGVPCVIGKNGCEKIINIDLNVLTTILVSSKLLVILSGEHVHAETFLLILLLNIYLQFNSNCSSPTSNVKTTIEYIVYQFLEQRHALANIC